MLPLYRVEAIPGRGMGVIASVDIPAGTDILIAAGVIVCDGDPALYCGFCAGPKSQIESNLALCSLCHSVSFCPLCIADERVKSIHSKECNALRDLQSSGWTIANQDEAEEVRKLQAGEGDFHFYGTPLHLEGVNEDSQADEDSEDNDEDNAGLVECERYNDFEHSEDVLTKNASQNRRKTRSEDSEKALLLEITPTMDSVEEDDEFTYTRGRSSRRKPSLEQAQDPSPRIIQAVIVDKISVKSASPLAFTPSTSPPSSPSPASSSSLSEWDGSLTSLTTPHPLFGVPGQCKCTNCQAGILDQHIVSDANLSSITSLKLRRGTTSAKVVSLPPKTIDPELHSRTKFQGTAFLRLLVRLLAHRKQEMDELGFSRRRRRLPAEIVEWNLHQHRAVSQLFGFHPSEMSEAELEMASNTVQQALFLLGSSARCNKEECLSLLSRLYANTMQLTDATRHSTSLHHTSFQSVFGAAVLRSPEDELIMSLSGGYSTAPKDICTGIFPEACRFNHSCLPNCVYTFNPTPHPGTSSRGFSPSTPSLTVRTLMPVRKGQELCISYVDTGLETRVRRAMLSKTFHFDCDCVRCVRWTYEACEKEAAEHISCVIIPRGMFADQIKVKAKPKNRDITPVTSYIPNSSYFLTYPGDKKESESESMAEVDDDTDNYRQAVIRDAALWPLYTSNSIPESFARGYVCSCGTVVSVTSLQFARKSILSDTFECQLNRRVQVKSPIDGSPVYENRDVLYSSGKTVFWPKYKDIFLNDLLTTEANLVGFHRALGTFRASLYTALGLGGIFINKDMEDIYAQADELIRETCLLYPCTRYGAVLELSSIPSTHFQQQKSSTQLLDVMGFFIYAVICYASQHKIDHTLVLKMAKLMPPLVKLMWFCTRNSLRAIVGRIGLLSSLNNTTFVRLAASLLSCSVKLVDFGSVLANRVASKELPVELLNFTPEVPWQACLADLHHILICVSKVESPYVYHTYSVSTLATDDDTSEMENKESTDVTTTFEDSAIQVKKARVDKSVLTSKGESDVVMSEQTTTQEALDVDPTHNILSVEEQRALRQALVNMFLLPAFPPPYTM